MVKRYELNFCDNLEESKNGYLVYFEDYQKLEKELAELKERMCWRDVSQELPDLYAPVILADGADVITEVFHLVDRDLFGVECSPFFLSSDEQCYGINHVSNWLPLPTPPNNK